MQAVKINLEHMFDSLILLWETAGSVKLGSRQKQLLFLIHIDI